jgi:ParB-like chromosome segregation protein Spo0J
VSAHPRYEAHPAAEALPLLEGAAFEALVAGIKANGLISPIALIDGMMILDGRNRMRASCAAGVEPRFGGYQVDDPFALVISANIERRRLDESQRVMCATIAQWLVAGFNQIEG